VKDCRADFVHAPFFRTSQHAAHVSPALLPAAQVLDANYARCSAGTPLENFAIRRDANPMRAILHATFGTQLAKPSNPSDQPPLAGPGPDLRDSPVDEFEASLLKARGASRGPTRTATYHGRIARPR
jgi:hypothetical protein